MSRAPGLLMILTENETLVDRDDLGALVELAVIAEREGFDAVMLSEHVALGPSADANGLPTNPRMYAAPGNQDPRMSWPSSIVMASAIAQATTSIRIVLGALITPLRSAVVLAKDLATLDRLSQGRLVVQPTVSWHEDEYAAVGVPFEQRGRILDEQLEAMSGLWGPSPSTFHGTYVHFDDVYCEPKPWRPEGPLLWFGGQTLHPPLLRRLVSRGSGFHPFGTPSATDLETLASAMAAAGRSIDDLERIGGTRAVFEGPDDLADVMASMSSFRDQLEAGCTIFCMKPSQHTDDIDAVPAICRQMVAHLGTLTTQ